MNYPCPTVSRDKIWSDGRVLRQYKFSLSKLLELFHSRKPFFYNYKNLIKVATIKQKSTIFDSLLSHPKPHGKRYFVEKSPTKLQALLH